MKNIIFIFLTLLSSTSWSQKLPSIYAEGFAFNIGSKFTVKLDTHDKSKITYSITKMENFTETIDLWENDKLFARDGEEGTIDFYFCFGTHGETAKEKEENMQVVLLMKNRTKFALSYLSEIQRQEEGEFEKTSNIGTYPGAKGSETWPYMIYAIGIRDFKVMD